MSQTQSILALLRRKKCNKTVENKYSKSNFVDMSSYKNTLPGDDRTHCLNLFNALVLSSIYSQIQIKTLRVYYILQRWVWYHNRKKDRRVVVLVNLFSFCCVFLHSLISFSPFVSVCVRVCIWLFVDAHDSTAVCVCLSGQQISGFSPSHIPLSAQTASTYQAQSSLMRQHTYAVYSTHTHRYTGKPQASFSARTQTKRHTET